MDLGEAVSVRPAEEADCAYIGPADRSPAAGADASACAVTGHRVRGAEFSRDRLRAALRPFANRAAGLDFLRAARHNKKKAAALLLYALHLPGAYAHLPNKEEKLLA